MIAGKRTAKNLNQVSQVDQVKEEGKEEEPAGVPKLDPPGQLPSQAVHQHVQGEVAHLTLSYLTSSRCTTGGGARLTWAGQRSGSNQSEPKMRSGRERGFITTC